MPINVHILQIQPKAKRHKIQIINKTNRRQTFVIRTTMIPFKRFFHCWQHRITIPWIFAKTIPHIGSIVQNKLLCIANAIMLLRFAHPSFRQQIRQFWCWILLSIWTSFTSPSFGSSALSFWIEWKRVALSQYCRPSCESCYSRSHGIWVSCMRWMVGHSFWNMLPSATRWFWRPRVYILSWDPYRRYRKGRHLQRYLASAHTWWTKP